MVHSFGDGTICILDKTMENVISIGECKVENVDTIIHNSWVHSKEGKEILVII